MNINTPSSIKQEGTFSQYSFSRRTRIKDIKPLCKLILEILSSENRVLSLHELYEKLLEKCNADLREALLRNRNLLYFAIMLLELEGKVVTMYDVATETELCLEYGYTYEEISDGDCELPVDVRDREVYFIALKRDM